MTKTAVGAATPDERDEKIARLEKQVGDLVDAIVKLAGERPVYVPCQIPHYPQPYYPSWPQPYHYPYMTTYSPPMPGAVSTGASTVTVHNLSGPGSAQLS